MVIILHIADCDGGKQHLRNTPISICIITRGKITVGTRLLHGSVVARSQLLHDTGSMSGPVRRP